MPPTGYRSILLAIFGATLWTPLVSASLLSSGGGLAGFGRTLYQPTCCYACLDSLWSLSLPCAISDRQQSFATNPPSCHASDASYLESLAWCMETRCGSEGVDETRTNECWGKIAGDGLQVGDRQSYLSSKPNMTLQDGATTLTQASLIDDATYEISKASLLSYASSQRMHELYA